MKKVDLNDFYNVVKEGKNYKDICVHFGIKTKDEFKRYLYDASMLKGEFIAFEFPKHKNIVDVAILKDGSVKVSRHYIKDALEKMGITDPKLEVSYDVEKKEMRIGFAA